MWQPVHSTNPASRNWLSHFFLPSYFPSKFVYSEESLHIKVSEKQIALLKNAQLIRSKGFVVGQVGRCLSEDLALALPKLPFFLFIQSRVAAQFLFGYFLIPASLYKMFLPNKYE